SGCTKARSCAGRWPSCSVARKSRKSCTWTCANMETLREIFGPNFQLWNSIYVSLLVGLICPLIGVYLILRRLIFMGVALPQISSCGIAFAFALQAWGVIPHIHEQEHALAFFGAT